MSRVERKEYQETKIMRTVSPVRGTRGSTQNLAEFDQNLDHLLEDLQSSVSRPGSSLGSAAPHTYRETSRNVSSYDSGRSNSLNRITNLKPQNPVTDYSSDDAYSYTSPDGSKNVRTFKKETYSYKTTGDKIVPEKIRMQNNINQLDSLLDDLQQVKQSSSEISTFNSPGADPAYQDQKVGLTKRSAQRELHYGDTPRPSSRSRTLERAEREASVTRDVQYIGDGSYGDLRTVRHSSPSPSRSGTLSKQTKVTNVHTYPVEVVETTTPEINPEILASLDPNLLPTGNTKVTTTIKTYTYEIPGAGYPSAVSPNESEKYVYSPNQSQTTPSKSFVYNKVENNTLTRNVNVDAAPLYQKPSPPLGTDKSILKETVTTRNYQPGYRSYSPDDYGSSPKQTYIYNESTTTRNLNQNGYPDGKPYPEGKAYPEEKRYPDSPPRKETYIVKETHNTTTNTGPNYPQNPPRHETYIVKETHNTNTTNQYPEGAPSYPQHPPRQETYIVKETHNTNTINDYPVGNRPYPQSPPRQETYIVKETHNTNTTNQYPAGNPPFTQNPPFVQNPPRQETYIIKETHNTHTNVGPNYPPHGTHPQYPPNDQPPNQTTIIYKQDSRTNNIDKPYPPNEIETFDPKHPPYPHGARGPKEPINVTYKYSSHSTTTNNVKSGYPPGDESEPLLHPRPFPTDNSVDGPPKKLDELMATIGKEPPNSALNAGFNHHEAELAKQKKVDTLKQQHEDLEKKEPKDLQRTKNVTGPPVYYPPGHEMFAKKEESGAWRAEGAMSKESGKYKYEAESKSKSKSSSGAAIVPVCLPLCCGLPCTIL